MAIARCTTTSCTLLCRLISQPRRRAGAVHAVAGAAPAATRRSLGVFAMESQQQQKQQQHQSQQVHLDLVAQLGIPRTMYDAGGAGGVRVRQHVNPLKKVRSCAGVGGVGAQVWKGRGEPEDPPKGFRGWLSLLPAKWRARGPVHPPVLLLTAGAANTHRRARLAGRVRRAAAPAGAGHRVRLRPLPAGAEVRTHAVLRPSPPPWAASPAASRCPSC